MKKQMFETVSDIIKQDEQTSLFLVDIGVHGFRDILNENSDRAMNIGIFEDGMISVAAGLALEGINPIVYGISPFIICRAFEQLKLDFGYQKLGGNFIGTGASYDFSALGYSHYCAEDLGLIKMIPDFQFIAPSTAKEFDTLFRKTYNNGKPTFFRLTDHVNSHQVDVKFGEANVIRTGTKCTIVAISTTLEAIMEAFYDEDVTILYYSTLLPFDSYTLRQHCRNKRVLLCEPHYQGTLTTEVIQALPKNEPVHIRYCGLRHDMFRNYGTKAEKDKQYNMIAKHIKANKRYYLFEDVTDYV